MSQIKYFEGDLWILDGTSWTNLSSKTKTAKDREYYIKGMIKHNMLKAGQAYVEQREINRSYSDLMMDSVYGNNVEITDINTNIILTTNKTVDLVEGTIKDNTNGATIFTPYQINTELYQDEDNADVELAKRFIKELTQGDKRMETLLFEIIGTSMSPRNESIFPVLYSPHKSSGKGTIMDIIGNLNGLTREIKGEKWWSEGNNFSLSSIRNQLVGWIDEVPATLPKASTEKIKSYADDKKFLEIERKGIDQEKMLNTTTFIATTNHKTELYSVDDSIKGRMIWIQFGMNLYGKPKFTKQEIETIKNSKAALSYFATKGVEAYLQVLKRAGTRKERYTQVDSDIKFWSGIKEQSVAVEILESGQETALLWDAKESFLSNEVLKQTFDIWKISNKDVKMSFKIFQNELIGHIHANKLGTADRGAVKNVRGIKINWSKEDNEMVLNHFGDRVNKTEWNKFLEAQAAEAELVQKEMEDNRG